MDVLLALVGLGAIALVFGFFDELGDSEAMVTPETFRERKAKGNAPCHCGSGKRYKNCHLQPEKEALGQRRTHHSIAFGNNPVGIAWRGFCKWAEFANPDRPNPPGEK